MSIPTQTNSSEATTLITAITCEQMRDAEDHLCQYILAWLDTTLADDKTAFAVSLGLLRIVQQVHNFNDVQKCLDYLNSNTEKQAFLVLSCEIDEHLLNTFLALPQLEYIYVFGRETILKKEHAKLVEVTSIQKLYSRLSRDTPSSNEEDDDTDFASLESNVTAKSTRGFEGDARIFIFYQLLIEILLRLPKTPGIREQFISFCMEKTNDNSVQQKNFQEFMKDYKPEKAILWYTSTCFLHKLLNRTCRLGNLKDMFKLAFFMTDLSAQMKELHDKNFEWYDDITHIYRGRPMFTMEFNKLKASIGDLVVTKSFLSATEKPDVALFYAGAGTIKPDFVPAILHMKINKQRNETKPFAFTRSCSIIKADDEVLLSIGTIFRIDEEKCKDGVHEFILIRGDAEEQVERQIKNTFRGQTAETDAFSNLDGSTNIDECCKQVLELLSSSGDQASEQLGQAISSKNTKNINIGADSIVKTPVTPHVSLEGMALRRIIREIYTLRKEVKNIFILNIDLTDDETSPLSSGNIIDGRILPTAELYCQLSFCIRFTIPHRYPYDPPIARFPDPIYHPNIDVSGRICSRIMHPHDEYTSAITLSDMIISIEQLISNPDLDRVTNNEVAAEYQNNRNEFNRKARELVLKYGQPRA